MPLDLMVLTFLIIIESVELIVSLMLQFGQLVCQLVLHTKLLRCSQVPIN